MDCVALGSRWTCDVQRGRTNFLPTSITCTIGILVFYPPGLTVRPHTRCLTPTRSQQTRIFVRRPNTRRVCFSRPPLLTVSIKSRHKTTRLSNTNIPKKNTKLTTIERDNNVSAVSSDSRRTSIRVVWGLTLGGFRSPGHLRRAPTRCANARPIIYSGHGFTVVDVQIANSQQSKFLHQYDHVGYSCTPTWLLFCAYRTRTLSYDAPVVNDDAD